MRKYVIQDWRDIDQTEPTILVLGYFDGIHKGHQQLFQRARQLADQEGLKVALLTFPESPQLAFSRFRPELLLHLSSEVQREELLESVGVDLLYLQDFTSEFGSLTGQEFLDTYVSALKAQKLVVGFDYHFGCDRQGAQLLANSFPGQVEVIPSYDLDGKKVSSTRIRAALAEGEVEKVADLLGRPYQTCGIVVHGDARGRTIGYPTANLAPLDRVHMPADGVYVVDVHEAGQVYRGMASVGKNVTFEGDELRFEVNLFGFSADIYGHRLTIDWLGRLRDMVKFNSVQALIEQLEEDERQAKAWKEHS
ncbi:bifunctional riboflavin kinase/FAD synthetase [Streptococcus sp. NLN64]|uniref:bifunctional riboflavin kinase/FAD synthetase n=1 Tax=Streptococcus sp. NLN64 TaxID=2822799 RepID=UPI0018CB4ADC|nr:bifunctional riboflavin kinase/FAD synthetase [Streptococcus sp. NLN64]MBG9367867.1 bifunctional riboflavin kinase/FAD synthetase [Streptococcus sp. NLN64]